jgi:fluoride exporter
LGGALGSVARYLVAVAFLRARLPAMPWATFAVNVAGCYLLAVFSGLLLARGASEPLRLFATVGVCGGFTTYSTFNAELFALGGVRAGGYVLVTLVSCVTAAWLGQLTARAL